MLDHALLTPTTIRGSIRRVMDDKEFLDQTPPGGTVYGGIGPAAAPLAHGEAYAGILRVGCSYDPIEVAFRIMWLQSKYPGSVPSSLIRHAEVRLKKAIELSAEDLVDTAK